MALPISSALRSAGRFVLRNPASLLRVARHAAALQVAVPLDALRWLIANTPPSKKAPTDITVGARPPAIELGATIELMGTRVRAATAIRVHELRIHPDEMRLELHLEGTDLKVLDRSETPIAGLIRSGALDVSKPGNLAKFMPKRPPALIDARDNVLVLDLMKIPSLANNYRLRKILQRLTPVVHVSALKTDGDFLILGLRPTPSGFSRALAAG